MDAGGIILGKLLDELLKSGRPQADPITKNQQVINKNVLKVNENLLQVDENAKAYGQNGQLTTCGVGVALALLGALLLAQLIRMGRRLKNLEKRLDKLPAGS